MINNQRSKIILQRDYSLGSHQSGVTGRWQVKRNGLVGEWNGSGGWLDTAGTNNGTPANLTYGTSDIGYQSQWGVFNGTNAGVSLGTAAIPTGSSARTMMAWVSGTKKNNSVIYNVGGFTTDNNIGFSTHSDGQLKAYVFGRADLLSGVNMAGTHHVAITLSGTTLSIYVDGSLKNSGTYSTVNITAANHSIGSLGGTYYQGNIQTVRHFNLAISASEIRDYYLEGLKLLH